MPERPEELLGQEHLFGPGKPLTRFLEERRVPSMVMFGPSGTGKTAYANVVSGVLGNAPVRLNAARSTPTSLRKALVDVERSGGGVLFVDEIHRFNRAAQEVVLPFIDNGSVTLLGSTAANPFYPLSRALLSRLLVFEFEPLSADALAALLARAASSLSVEVPPASADALIERASGDGRRLLVAFEAVLSAYPDLTPEHVDTVVHGVLPRDADEHYDVLSAFIKSMRASEVDAALYWGFRLLEMGEDPALLLRRMCVFASEDVGMAHPATLTRVVSAAEAFDMTGRPEGDIILAHAIVHCSLAPKDRRVADAAGAVRECVLKNPAHRVPAHLRSHPPRGGADGTYLPFELSGAVFFPRRSKGGQNE